MEPTRTVSGWLACPVVEADRVAFLRDRLYGWLGGPEPYRRAEDPHLSLFGVRISEDGAADFERALAAFGETVGPWRVVTDGYLLYPSARNPMVVALDVPLSLTAVASPIADLLAEHGGRIGRYPVEGHVTLFKGGIRGEELQWSRVDEQTRARLAAAAGLGDAFEPPKPLSRPSFEITLDPPEIEWGGAVA